jgi:hypothetical protein
MDWQSAIRKYSPKRHVEQVDVDHLQQLGKAWKRRIIRVLGMKLEIQ